MSDNTPDKIVIYPAKDGRLPEGVRVVSGDFETSREAAKARRWDAEALSALVVDCAYNLHVEAGPGLMESVYEVVLARMLEKRDVRVQRQVPVHAKQTLTYIRLLGRPIGLLINFGASSLKYKRLVFNLRKSAQSVEKNSGGQP
ncbi:MAG: GxxExxY protein [Opitutaceae bacterium]|nr:GxxExxY protein [Opitutaceae bacterium]